MNETDWLGLMHFKSTENWGIPSMMDPRFMRTFDTLRHLCDTPFELTSPAYATSGHSSLYSWHGIGRAADFHVPKMLLLDAYDLILEKIKGMGIECGFGIYPDWNTPGFHFDDSGKPPGDSADRWVRIDDPKHGLTLGYHHPPKSHEYIEAIRWEHRVQKVKQ